LPGRYGITKPDPSGKKLERGGKIHFFFRLEYGVIPVVENGKSQSAEMQPQLMLFAGDGAQLKKSSVSP
jgi:hypothetical protein